MANICIYEDEYYTNFLPLVYTRPVYELICGCSTLREKISKYFPKSKVNLHCRDYLSKVLKTSFPKTSINRISGESCLFINGRVLPERNLSPVLSKNRADEAVFLKGKELAAVQLRGKRLEKIKEILNKKPMELSGQLKKFIPELSKIQLGKEINLAYYLWDLVNQNAYWLKKDAEATAKLGKCLSEIPKGAYVIGGKNVFIDKGVKINPAVVIEAKSGPVIIEKNVKISSQVTIIGPAYVGEGSVLKTGAKIYPGTTLGKVCKIGGEIDNSIIHDFTNKQHHGFIGHSYLGSWINLGAGTSNSDLKNNYHPVKVFTNGKFIDTGLTFIGLFMGDHSKSGINSVFNTGTVVGISCNIFGSDFPPKFIPSFSWGEGGDFFTYKLEEALETAHRVMLRRKVKLSLANRRLLEKIFYFTRGKRREILNEKS